MRLRLIFITLALAACGPGDAFARPHTMRGAGGARRTGSGGAIVPSFLMNLAWDNQWVGDTCTSAPWAFRDATGGANIPESATNTAHTCGATTESDTGTELIGSGAGLYTAGIGTALVSKGVSMAGGANWINTTAGAIPVVTNQEQAICILFRPRGTPDYLLNIQSTATEFIRARFSSNSMIFETRCDGSSTQSLAHFTALGPLNQTHFACWRLFDVCEVQAAGRGCMSITMDGQILNGSEFATDINSYGASTSITIAADSAEASRFDGEIFWIGYSRTTAHTTSIFGTTRANFQDNSRSIIQRLGIGSGANSPTAPTRRVVMVIGAGQSAMVGFGATPVLTSANQLPHREGLGLTNALPLLHEGTGTGASESRGSSLCNEWAAWDSRIQCIWVERAVSNTSISVWNDGNVAAHFDTLETWWTRALDYGCGKWDTITVYVMWSQGPNDFPDRATWDAELAAIQDSFDTLVRARGCVNNVEVKMMVQQDSVWQDAPFSTATAALVDTRQVATIAGYSGRLYLSGPEYFASFQADSHPSNTGQQMIGRQNGRSLYRLDTTGSWLPLYVTGANVSGSDVIVDFSVPIPPLSVTCGDANAGSFGVTDPGNRGFEWSDANARTITAIGTPTCDSSSQPTTCHVTLTLSGAPGASRVLGIGRTGIVNNDSGPTTGPRTCIHDADVTAAGTHEPNWAVHQVVNVP